MFDVAISYALFQHHCSDAAVAGEYSHVAMTDQPESNRITLDT